MDSILYFGDNLDILRHHIDNESIDLIYLDPPFNSNRDYNVIFKEATGEESEAQLQAFSDSSHWTPTTQQALEEPSKNMLEEAITEGFYKSAGWQKQYQKIQIRTIEQLLHGKDFDMPPTNVSFKRAEKARQKSERTWAIQIS